jgi:protein TonB
MKKVLLILIAIIFALKTQAQKVETINPPTEDKIFTTDIDTAPEFIDGMDEFYAHLQHIRYTFSDRMLNRQGRVTVIMVIEKDGSLSNLKVIHGISEKQDEQILNVVKKLNKWKPGMVQGKPVRVLCAVPINFKMKQS